MKLKQVIKKKRPELTEKKEHRLSSGQRQFTHMFDDLQKTGRAFLGSADTFTI